MKILFCTLLTDCVHVNGDQQSHAGGQESGRHTELPIAGGRLELLKSLTERRTVQRFLLMNGQFLPVSLLFFAQSLLSRINVISSD